MHAIHHRIYFALICIIYTQTYEELMDLAAEGNNLNVDMTEAEITSKAAAIDQESEVSAQAGEDVMDEIYGKFAKLSTRPTFLWGKAVGTDTCKSYTCKKLRNKLSFISLLESLISRLLFPIVELVQCSVKITHQSEAVVGKGRGGSWWLSGHAPPFLAT